VRERWFSKRAVSLHAAVLVLVPGCAVAAWWQISRAQDGNQLSYVYSVMWPVFGVLALYFWWMLIHTDYDSVGLKGMRKRAEMEASRDEMTPTREPAPVGDVDDPELAAYNARLAELAEKGAKTWRSRESVVVRKYS
jgi:DNA-binding transcriptional regulator of glucitol operon